MYSVLNVFKRAVLVYQYLPQTPESLHVLRGLIRLYLSNSVSSRCVSAGNEWTRREMSKIWAQLTQPEVERHARSSNSGTFGLVLFVLGKINFKP